MIVDYYICTVVSALSKSLPLHDFLESCLLVYSHVHIVLFIRCILMYSYNTNTVFSVFCSSSGGFNLEFSVILVIYLLVHVFIIISAKSRPCRLP